jgi:RimJ/RimL family protein N-acetyltransferase
MTLEEAHAFINDLTPLEPGTPGEWFAFALELTATGVHIGDCALHVRADDPRQAEIGYTLARQYHGAGVATEAVRALLDYAFTTLQLHRVTATVDCDNSPSMRLLERVGMRREGHFRQCTWFKGQWCDEYLYAILREEWAARVRHHPAA